MQGARQFAVAQGEDGLDDTGGARGGLGVAQVGLDGTEQQRLLRVAALAVGGDQSVGLDRVAQGGAGAVRLDGVDLRRGEVRVGQRLADDALLGAAVGRGEAVGGAVLVDGRATQHGEDGVAVAAGVGEALQDEDAGALAPGGAVRGVGEGLAAAVAGQAALRGELHEGVRARHHGDAAGEGQGALAGAQRPGGHVQGHQRRGAGGVDGDRRALQPQGVGQAAGHHAGGGAGRGVAPHVGGATPQHGGVVLAVGADEDAGGAGAQALRVDAGPLQGLPGGLQQQALLGVHRESLARGDAEERGVEESGALEESALQGGGAATGQRVQVPAAVGGEAGDGVAALAEELPELLGRLDTAGEAAAHADHDDRVGLRGAGSLVGRVPARRRLGQVAQDLGQEVGGQVAGGRVVVDEGGGQAQAGGGAQGVAQFDGGERVEAEVGEGLVGFDGVRVGVTQDGGDLGAQEVQHVPLAGGAGQGGDLPPQRRFGVAVGGGRAAGGAYLGQVTDEGAVRGEDGGVARPVDVGEEERGVAVADGGVEGGEGVLGAHRGEAATPDPVLDAGALAGHAGAGPGAPGHRGGGQALFAPVFGEGVEVGVGGGVVGLAGGAEGAGRRGEQDEVGEAEVAGQLVQVGGGAGLGVEDGGEPLRGEGVQEAVVEDARRVHHGGEGAVGGHLGQERGERLPVGGVAGGEGDLGAQFPQLGGEFGGAGSLRATPPGEQQVRRAAPGQEPGDVGAEGAGAAGDQDGALGGERTRRFLGGRVVGDPPCVGGGGADGELVLRAGHGQEVRQPAGDAGVELLGQVDQGEAARRVLQGGGPAEAPHTRLPGAGQPVGASGAHGLPGDDPQGRGDPGVVQGVQGGGRRRHGAGPCHVVGGGGGVEGQQGEDAGEALLGARQPAQGVGERGTVGVREVDGDLGGVQAEGVQQGGGLGRGGAGRAQDQPGALGPSGGGAVERLPHGPVAAAVGDGLCGAAAPPRGQGRHQGGQRVVVQAEVGAERGQVGPLDGRPERGVGAGVGGARGRGRGEGGVGPVAAALEGVGGQVDAAGAGSLEGAGPVDGGAVDVQPGEGGGEGRHLVAVAAQRGDDGDGPGTGGVGRVGVEDVAGGGREGAVGAEFQAGGDALAGEGAYGVGEPDGGTDLADPVLGRTQFLRGGGGAGDGGDHRHERRLVGEAAGDAGEVVEHGVHARRVEGVADLQRAGAAAVLGEAGGDGGDRLLVACDHHGARAVHRGQGDPVLASLQEGQYLFLARLDGDHGAARRKGGHEAATGGDEGAGVVQGEDPRHVGGGDLPDGVADDLVGAHPPGLDEPVQRHFEGEQGGLRVRRVVQERGLGSALVGEEHLAQRAVQVLVEAGEDGVQGFREDRVTVVQLPSHGRALTALAGEEEGEPSSCGGAGEQRGVGGAPAQRGERPQQAVPVAGEDGGAVFQGAAGGGQRVGQVHQRYVRTACEVSGEAVGLLTQGGRGPGGEHDGDARRQGGRVAGGDRGCGGLGRGLLGRLLDDGVDVGAGEAEGGDGGPVGASGLGPRHGLGGQVDGAGAPVDVAGGGVDVQGARDGAVPHRHDHLHDTGDAGGHLGVADVGLHRAEQQRPVPGPVLSVRRQQGLGLDRVPEGGAGAVALDHVHLARGEPGVGEGLADDARLGGAVGGGEAVRGAVLVDGGTPDDGEDGVAVAARVGQPLDEDQADALGQAHAVGTLGVRLAAAVGGHRALAAEAGERLRGGHDADAARQGEGGLAVAQRLAGQVERDQGGGAGGVQGDGRALQAEGVGEPAGHHAGDGAGDQVALGTLGAGAARGVVLVAGADEGTGHASAQGRGVDARALDGLPAGLQQQALLGVHRQCLARGDPEEAGVEVGDVVEETALRGVGGAGPVGVRVVEGVGVPAPVGGEAGDGVGAGRDQLPQGLGRTDAAGVAAAHRDDGDRLVVGGGRGAERALGVGGGTADQAAQIAHEGERVRVVEHHGARQGEASDGGQPVAQVDGGERVEPDVAEGATLRQHLRGGVAEDGGGLRADEFQQEAVLLAGGQGAQAVGELSGLAGAGLVLLGEAADLGHVLEELGGPRGGEDGVVAVPVDVGDGDGALVPVEDLPESGEGEPRVHELQAAAADLAGVDPAELHVVGPDAPGDRGPVGASGAPVLGERVDMGVGGDVRGVPAAPPHAGGGRVEDERVELVVVEEFVEVRGARGLGVDDLGERVEAGLLDGLELDDGGGVEDAADGAALGGETVEERDDRLAVGDVAGGDRHPAAAFAEFGGEFGGAGGVRATAAGEDQVTGALVGEPAGQVRAERSGAAGDQDRAARAPAAGAGGRRGRGDAAGQDAGGAHGQLVLAGGAGQDGGETFARPAVQGLGQVDGAAPPLRVFQGRGPAEALDEGLGGPGEAVGAPGGDGAAGERPEGCLDPGVAEGLRQCDAEGETGGEDRVGGAGGLVVGQQGDHRGRLGQVAQPLRENCPVGVGVCQRQGQGPGAVRGQLLRHGGGVLRVGALRGDEQPGAVQGGGGERAERLPGGAVAPGPDGGTVALSTAPGGEGGQQRGERLPVEFQAGGEGLRVLPLDLGPELGVGGVAVAGALRAGGDGPQVLALEGVGGQGCPAGAGARVDRVPVGPAAAHPLFGEGGEEARGAALFAAQGADGDGRAGGLLGGGLNGHGQHGVGADLDEERVLGVEQGAHAVLEADGLPQVAVPVGGVHAGGVERGAGDRGVERDTGGAGCHRGEDVEEFGLDPLHLCRVGGVVHGDPAGPQVAGGELRLEGVQGLGRTGEDDGARAVDGGDGDRARVGGQVLLGLGGGHLDGHHAAGPGQDPADGLGAQGDDAGAVVEGEGAGDDGGGDLALGVADHRVGGDAVGPPQLREGDHHGPGGGLHDVDPVQGGRAVGLADDVDEVPVGVRGQSGRARVEPLGERR